MICSILATKALKAAEGWTWSELSEAEGEWESWNGSWETERELDEGEWEDGGGDEWCLPYHSQMTICAVPVS